jgi:hypothetical protein
MGRWLRLPFVWAWRAVTLRWLTPGARLPAQSLLLYAASVAFLACWLGPRPRLVVHPDGQVVPLAFTADGRTLAAFDRVGSDDRRSLMESDTLHLWDVATGTPVAQYRLPFRVQLSNPRDPGFLLGPDGRFLVLPSRDGEFGCYDVWDLPSGRLRSTCRPAPGLTVHRWPRSVALSPDGRHLASLVRNRWSEPSRVDVWDTTTGQLLPALKHPRLGVYQDGLCFSPDGRSLAVGVFFQEEPTGIEEGVLLYDLHERPTATLLRHAFQGAYTADGTRYWAFDRSESGVKLLMEHDLVTGRARPLVCLSGTTDPHPACDFTHVIPATGLIVSGRGLSRPKWPDWLVTAAQRVGIERLRQATIDETIVTVTTVPSDAQTVLSFDGCEQVACNSTSLAIFTGGRLEFWDLPLRPPWPLILGYAALPPGLVVLGVGLRRVWRRMAAPVAA